MERVFWQVQRIDVNCNNANLCDTVQEAAEEVLRALKSGFEVQVVKVVYTQEYYDSLDNFDDTGWEPNE